MLPSTSAINQSFRKEDAFTTGGPAFRVNEIFISINGEGPLTGEAAIFLRLSGCGSPPFFRPFGPISGGDPHADRPQSPIPCGSVTSLTASPAVHIYEHLLHRVSD